jgi:hypothetical protein
MEKILYLMKAENYDGDAIEDIVIAQGGNKSQSIR